MSDCIEALLQIAAEASAHDSVGTIVLDYPGKTSQRRVDFKFAELNDAQQFPAGSLFCCQEEIEQGDRSEKHTRKRERSPESEIGKAGTESPSSHVREPKAPKSGKIIVTRVLLPFVSASKARKTPRLNMQASLLISARLLMP